MKKGVLISSTCSLGVALLLGVGYSALNKTIEDKNQTGKSFATDIQIINEGMSNLEIVASDDLTPFFDDNVIYQQGDLKVNYYGNVNDYQIYKLNVELDPLLDTYIAITNTSWKIGESLVLNAFYKKGKNPTNPTTYNKMCEDLKDATIKLTFSITYNNQKES